MQLFFFIFSFFFIPSWAYFSGINWSERTRLSFQLQVVKALQISESKQLPLDLVQLNLELDSISRFTAFQHFSGPRGLTLSANACSHRIARGGKRNVGKFDNSDQSPACCSAPSKRGCCFAEQILIRFEASEPDRTKPQVGRACQ